MRPLLVIGGPGSGKSTLIAERASFLVSNGISPDEIAAITPSEHGAQRPFPGQGVALVPVGAFCAQLAFDFGKLRGAIEPTRLATSAAEAVFLRSLLPRLSLARFQPTPRGSMAVYVRSLQEHMHRLADCGVSPAAYLAWVARRRAELPPSKATAGAARCVCVCVWPRG
jgi:hypothetical protein